MQQTAVVRRAPGQAERCDEEYGPKGSGGHRLAARFRTSCPNVLSYGTDV